MDSRNIAMKELITDFGFLISASLFFIFIVIIFKKFTSGRLKIAKEFLEKQTQYFDKSSQALERIANSLEKNENGK